MGIVCWCNLECRSVIGWGRGSVAVAPCHWPSITPIWLSKTELTYTWRVWKHAITGLRTEAIWYDFAWQQLLCAFYTPLLAKSGTNSNSVCWRVTPLWHGAPQLLQQTVLWCSYAETCSGVRLVAHTPGLVCSAIRWHSTAFKIMKYKTTVNVVAARSCLTLRY